MSYPIHLLTTRELAALLKRAPGTLVRWRRKRIGPPFRRVHGRALYQEAEVLAWLLECRTTPSSPAPLPGG